MTDKHVGPAMTSALYRMTTALLPHLRMWDGTKIVDRRGLPSIRHAVLEFCVQYTVKEVQVLLEPCKPKAHFTITQVSRADARNDYDNAVAWTAGGGEVALLTELSWLADETYPLAPSDVYVVQTKSWPTKAVMAWFVFGRKREGRWWLL